jgi:predicted AlkP superfamily phosphohydrolase/phosphomutase
LTTGVINLPMTWPPHPMPPGCYLVSGMETPSIESPFTEPPDLADELRAMNYVCDLRIKLHERDIRSPTGVTSIAQDLLEVVRRREEATFKLLAERPTDVLVVVFETTDRLQHYAWRAIAELIADDGSLRRTPLHDAVEACYRELDRVVGGLLDEAAGPESYVLFVSDHGFGPLQTRFHVDQWLSEQGWLTYESGKASVRQRLRAPMQRVKKLIPRSVLRRGRRAFAVSRILHWQRTQAYSGRTMEHAIYINLQGREPQGIVPPEQYDDLRRRIAAALLELRDPRTGQRVVEAAYLREDLYHGAFVEEAPDLLFSLAPGYEPTSELSGGGLFSDALMEGAGIHQPEGIFVVLGPGVQPGVRLPEQAIQDVLPTLLYVLQAPIPTSLDGRLITTPFAPLFLAQHPPIYSHEPEPDAPRFDSVKPFSIEDSRRVEERLAALGYLN